MIYSCNVNHLMRPSLVKDKNGEDLIPLQYGFYWCWMENIPLSTDHTYIIILSKSQYSAGIKLLKNTSKLKILFESVGAYNDVHPLSSSNTVVVFELEEGFKPE